MAEEEEEDMKKAPGPDKNLRLIDKRTLCAKLCTSEASVVRWIRSNPAFPQPRRLGPGSVHWVLSEVEAFIEGLARAEYVDHAFAPNDL